jgi:addiction module HigA family antidote
MTVTPLHPGKHLAEELKELGMSAAALARNLGVPTNRITGILNRQRAITGDTALRLVFFSARVPSSGSIYRVSMSFVLPGKRRGKR